jgi:hypothetical protein
MPAKHQRSGSTLTAADLSVPPERERASGREQERERERERVRVRDKVTETETERGREGEAAFAGATDLLVPPERASD